MSVGKGLDGVVLFGNELLLAVRRGQGVRTNVRNSSRVFGSSRKPPNMAEVTVLALIFCTPLMTMHMCLSRKTKVSLVHVKCQVSRQFVKITPLRPQHQLRAVLPPRRQPAQFVLSVSLGPVGAGCIFPQSCITQS